MLASQETQIVSTFIEEYKPEFDEETGEYYDECPYEKYKRSKITARDFCNGPRTSYMDILLRDLSV